MKTSARTGIAALTVLLLLLAGSQAGAQERNAYRHVDAAGKVTYSQTPPVDGKAATKVDIAPAHRGRGGYVNSNSPYDDPRYYAGQSGYDRYAMATQSRSTARDQRSATLKTECERQRGTDCNNPAALQYQDSTSIPRRGRYY